MPYQPKPEGTYKDAFDLLFRCMLVEGFLEASAEGQEAFRTMFIEAYTKFAVKMVDRAPEGNPPYEYGFKLLHRLGPAYGVEEIRERVKEYLEEVGVVKKSEGPGLTLIVNRYYEDLST